MRWDTHGTMIDPVLVGRERGRDLTSCPSTRAFSFQNIQKRIAADSAVAADNGMSHFTVPAATVNVPNLRFLRDF